MVSEIKFFVMMIIAMAMVMVTIQIMMWVIFNDELSCLHDTNSKSHYFRIQGILLFFLIPEFRGRVRTDL